MVDIPRAAWVLVGFSIGLFAVSAGLGELARTYEELYDLGLCDGYKSTDGRPNSSLETCKNSRLMAGAAHVGSTMANVPAVGLLMVAAAFAFVRARSGVESAGSPPQEEAEGADGSSPLALAQGAPS